ncbi:MAG: hypothetical protein BWK79_14065 [Beggiatoa sp. IS2]|nr:MAG: hypothetical protein BWK79_14065 [Beggiatoa sp. IS2]
MHIRNRFNKRAKPKSLEEIAAALSFISWKIASHAVLEIENQGFKTTSNAHRLQIASEFLIFLLQVSDRLSVIYLEEQERSPFVTMLALRTAEIIADNQRDLLKEEGHYREAFIERLNQRANDYAELSFNDNHPGFDFLRYFGEQVAITLSGERWVSEYVVDVLGPEATHDLQRSFVNLLNHPRTDNEC